MNAIDTAPVLLRDPLAADFIRALFGEMPAGSFIEFRPIEERRKDEPKGKPIEKARRWYSCDEALIEALPTIVETCRRKRWGAFYGVLPRAVYGKGDSASVQSGRTLWTDIDFRDFAGGEDEARDRLRGFPAQPSILVRSGHGLHCYWLLWEDEPAVALVRYNQGLAAALGGDATFDRARILRLPGSYNVKRPDDPRLVQVERLDPDVRCGLADLDEWIAVPEEEDVDRVTVDWSATRAAGKGLHAEVVAAIERHPDLADLLQGRGKPEKAPDGRRLDCTRSGYDWSLLQSLVRVGVTNPEALRSALIERHALTGRDAKEKSIRRQVENAIARAAAKARAPTPQQEQESLGQLGQTLERGSPAQVEQASPADAGRARAYARGALRGAVKRVAEADESTRKAIFSREAFILGGYVAAGLISEAMVLQVLARSGIRDGIPKAEAWDVAGRQVQAGKATPRHPVFAEVTP